MHDFARTSIAARALAVLAYHRRTRHRLDGYATGPETLDWDAQPNPYRHFAGCPVTPLPLVSDRLAAPYAAITGQQRQPSAPLTLAALAGLLELSFGLAAHKVHGPDSWSLHCNPSSGNLHPTEAYVLAGGVAGLADGVHHYRPDDHALEQRRAAAPAVPGLWIGLSSIQWREAWKYGERAFRYCQLDLGHALGCIAAACALLGWRASIVAGMEGAAVGALLGLDRIADFAGVEGEEPEVLIHIDTAPANAAPHAAPPPRFGDDGGWLGMASRVDPHPMYHWPIIDTVAGASRGPVPSLDIQAAAPGLPPPDGPAAPVILKRRSAQRYARDHVMPRVHFARMLASVTQVLAGTELGLLAYVHNVEGVERGLYALTGHDDMAMRLRAGLDPRFLWLAVPGMEAAPGFRLLSSGDFRKLVRILTCHQAIAADACVTFAMLAPLESAVATQPWRYRALHWQAGLVGQRLYLEAEALGHNGTGIGCFLDEEVNRVAGITEDGLAPVYHFAVGRALVDERISALPAYPGRTRAEADPFAP
jgi:SagB-type dehydrogenase family enzyme